MSSEYVITDDETEEVIPQGMPHYEVSVDRRHVAGHLIRYPALHFISLASVVNYIMESPDVVKFEITKK